MSIDTPETPNHDLHIVAGKGAARAGTCGCGEKIEGSTATAVTKRWVVHVAEVELLGRAVDAARREHYARAECEQAIAELVESGVPTAKIAEAIGTNGGDKPIMSATTVQRIARTYRGEGTTNESTPRRRRR